MDLNLVLPDSTQTRQVSIDFASYEQTHIHEFMICAVQALREEVSSGEWAVATVNTVAQTLRTDLAPWLMAASSNLGRSFSLSDVDKRLLEEYAADLKILNEYSTAGIKFSAAMILIKSMSRLGYLAAYPSISPANQFPGMVAAQKATQPYSKRERDELLRALAADFRDIRDGTHPSIHEGSTDSIVIGLLLLAIPTGINLTPLLEIGRDALREHPLHRNEWMLVAFKRRGNKEVSASVKWSDKISAMRSLDLHLVPVFEQIKRWTDSFAIEIDELHRNLVFIRPPLSKGGRISNRPLPLTASDFGRIVLKLNDRYAIQADGGGVLHISTRRIRATLAARIYDLSGGDPFVVARVLGNLPRTTAIHYLEPEFGASAKFAKAVTAFSLRLRQARDERHEKTPVGGCSDPLNGRFAPKDGITYCQRWLHCFQCPNQCITGDETALWRLYSFYWLLLEKSKSMRRLRISGQVRFALHVIDTIVTERFGDAALKARDRARSDPHPIWAIAKNTDAFLKEVADV